jgi:hypothetical protein
VGTEGFEAFRKKLGSTHQHLALKRRERFSRQRRDFSQKVVTVHHAPAFSVQWCPKGRLASLEYLAHDTVGLSPTERRITLIIGRRILDRHSPYSVSRMRPRTRRRSVSESTGWSPM